MLLFLFVLEQNQAEKMEPIFYSQSAQFALSSDSLFRHMQAYLEICVALFSAD
jgi:hypothetical protein